MIQKINNIQIFRAIAALLVVFFHSMGSSLDYGFKLTILSPLYGWGFGGVDLFFVISGFIMIYTQSINKRVPIHFMMDRILRIVPLYWTLTTLIVVISILFPSVFNVIRINFDWAIASYFFSSQGLEHHFPLLYDGWTLEYEMFFYFILFCSLYAKQLNATVIIASIFLLIWSTVTSNYILIEFVFGMLLGLSYIKQKKIFKNSLIILMIGIIGFIFTVTIDGLNDKSFLRLCFYGISSSFILYGGLWVKQLKKGVLTCIGDASYSIYLIQVFTIPAFYKAAKLIGVNSLYSDIWPRPPLRPLTSCCLP